MSKFFAECRNDRDALFFEFLLKTGCREREATTAEFTDISVVDGAPAFQVQNKPELDFRVKTGTCRMIPLEQGLYKKLLFWQMMNKGQRFMFGTGNDKPDTHFLETCKTVAKRAGMDRTKFKLHRFRDTFATWALRRGVDLRTVSHWLGHANIEMTQKYLAPMQGKQAQGEINRAFSTTLAVSATA